MRPVRYKKHEALASCELRQKARISTFVIERTTGKAAESQRDRKGKGQNEALH